MPFFFILLWIGFGFLGRWVAAPTRKTEGFVLGFLLGPIGMIIAVLLKDRPVVESQVPDAYRDKAASDRYAELVLGQEIAQAPLVPPARPAPATTPTRSIDPSARLLADTEMPTDHLPPLPPALR